MQASYDLPAGTAQHNDARSAEGRAEDQAANQNAPSSLGCHIGVLIKTSSCELVGVIQDIRTRALSIAIRRPLPEGSSVSVEFGAACRDGEIVSCRRDGDRYEICVVIPNRNASDQQVAERRVADRFPVTQEVLVSADSLAAPLEAVVIDLSTRGMGLKISAPLKVKEIITIDSAQSEAFGIVRHCRLIAEGHFHVGVEIFHVMPKEPA
jgi:hypothetical protein